MRVDVRIVAASHKDLANMVAHKQFREDLFYRVNVLKITVPPLRERVADIPRLAQHFVAKHWKAHKQERPAPMLCRALSRGSSRIRGLATSASSNEMGERRMLVLAGDAELTGSMVSTRVAGMVAAPAKALRDALSTAEAEAMSQAVGRHLGNRDGAAADLGISRARTSMHGALRSGWRLENDARLPALPKGRGRGGEQVLAALQRALPPE